MSERDDGYTYLVRYPNDSIYALKFHELAEMLGFKDWADFTLLYRIDAIGKAELLIKEESNSIIKRIRGVAVCGSKFIEPLDTEDVNIPFNVVFDKLNEVIEAVNEIRKEAIEGGRV